MTKFNSKDMRVYLGQWELGTAMMRVSVVQAVAALAPTALGDGAERALPGLRQDKLETDLIFDDSTSADAAAATLIGSSTNNLVSVYFGTGTGNVAYCGTGYIMGHQPESPDVKGLVRLIMPFTPDQTWKRGGHFGPNWSGGSGSLTGSIDNTTLTTGGSTWYIHQMSNATGTAIAQDSADGTTFSAIGSLAVTAATSGLITTTGTVRRYTRLTVAAAGGSLLTISAAIVRT